MAFLVNEVRPVHSPSFTSLEEAFRPALVMADVAFSSPWARPRARKARPQGVVTSTVSIDMYRQTSGYRKHTSNAILAIA